MPASRQPALPPTLAAAVVCALAGAAVFQWFGNANLGYIDSRSLFYWWGFQWLNPASESEHGWLILGLSAWLLWRNLGISNLRSEISDSRRSHFPTAAVTAMIVGLGVHALGFAAQQARLSIVALLLFTWGVLRFGGGRRWGAAAVFPLGFLLFAIPIGVLDEIGLPLRLWVTTAGEHIAKLAGIEVLRSGTQLVAPDGRFNYDVAAPCSGVRSLMALAALSLLLGYLNFQSWSRRALVLLLCFPLVYAGNVARIVSIIFSAQWGGPKWGGIAHEVMGYGVFAIVLGGVFAVVSAFRRFWPEREAARDVGDVSSFPMDEVSGPTRLTAGRAVAVIVAGLALGEMFLLHALAHRPARGEVGVILAADGVNPVELPAFLGTDWIGRRAEVSAVEREILPADTGFSRKSYAFVADRRHDVFLSLVLSGRDRSSIHRPELCLVGQGWTIAEGTPLTFRYPATVDTPSGAFPARLLRVRREVSTPRGKTVVPQLVAYWFVGGDTIVASHWRRLALDAWNRVVHGRADRWAYVLMQTDATDGEAAALARLQAVLDETLPQFQRSRRTPTP